jgi:purine-nucleoside phosphorylase
VNGSYGSEAAAEAAAVIRRHGGSAPPDVAVILGSGLGRLGDRLVDRIVIPYHDVPGFPAPTVAGHSGAVICGMLGNRRVIALSGRFHLYEGHGAQVAAFPVRVVSALGAATLVVTNAAGGVNSSFAPGDLMLISDQLNLTFRNPLIGAVEAGDERFPDMSDPYSEDLRRIVRGIAHSRRIQLQEGVYAGLLGPSYETPAEVRMLARIGADAVGMSTVAEVIVARARGMRVIGLSCITNMACGISATPISHAEVLETTLTAAGRMSELVEGVVAELPAH